MQVCHPQHIWPFAFQQTGGVSTLNGQADSDKTWIKIKNSYARECGSAPSATALSSSLFRFTFKSFRSNKPKFLSLFFKNSSPAPFFGGWKASTLKRKTFWIETKARHVRNIARVDGNGLLSHKLPALESIIKRFWCNNFKKSCQRVQENHNNTTRFLER